MFLRDSFCVCWDNILIEGAKNIVWLKAPPCRSDTILTQTDSDINLIIFIVALGSFVSHYYDHFYSLSKLSLGEKGDYRRPLTRGL